MTSNTLPQVSLLEAFRLFASASFLTCVAIALVVVA
jgi:hypothetical protein